jgi:hypothetical protein
VAFHLAQVQYDPDTQRAYVEMRGPDDDGGEVLVTAIFSFRQKAALSRQERDRDLVRKARHIFKKSALGLDGA